MRVLAWVTCCVLVTVFAAAGCGKKDQVPTAPPAAATGVEGAIAQKMCPVMNEPIDPKIFTDYKGRRIYFCCPMCPPVFEKDPEKYIKIVDEQLKGGAPAK